MGEFLVSLAPAAMIAGVTWWGLRALRRDHEQQMREMQEAHDQRMAHWRALVDRVNGDAS
jgi:hypothetical protein